MPLGAVEKAGYTAFVTIATQKESEKKEENTKQFHELLISFIFSV